MSMKLFAKKWVKQVNKMNKKGTKNRPRLCIFRSNKHIYAQVIDDINHKTIITSSSLSKNLKNLIKSSKNCEAAEIVGKDIGNKLKEKGIDMIIFDRGNKLYHGRIKALAEATRVIGIQF